MPKIIAQSAALTVSDFSRALAFWTDIVGFSLLESFGEPPAFAILRHDAAYQMIGLAKSGSTPAPARLRRDGLMDVYFWVDDAKAWHDAIAAKGARFAAPLELQPYNVLEFMIEDPDGHHIAFGQDMSGDIGRAD